MSQQNNRIFCCQETPKLICLHPLFVGFRLGCHQCCFKNENKGKGFVSIKALTNSQDSLLIIQHPRVSNQTFSKKLLYLREVKLIIIKVISVAKLARCQEQEEIKKILQNSSLRDQFKQQDEELFIQSLDQFIELCRQVAKNYAQLTSQEFLKEATKVLRRQDEVYNFRLATLQHTFEEQINIMLSENNYWMSYIAHPLLSSSLCPQDFYVKLNEKVFNKITGSKLIYSSSLHNKDSQTLWEKLKNTHRTLMLIKVKNQQIIGAYVSSWSLAPGEDYVTNCQSFIFSVVKQEIYPSKSVFQLNIQCSKTQPPSFGDDLFITTDFEIVSLALGTHYNIDEYDVVDQATHLAGRQNMKIVELEIYQLIQN